MWVVVSQFAPLKDIKSWASRRWQENVVTAEDYATLAKVETVDHLIANMCPVLQKTEETHVTHHAEEEEEEVYVWSNSGGSYVAGKDPSPAPSPVKSLPFDDFDANYAGDHMPIGCAQLDPAKCFVPALHYQGYCDDAYNQAAYCSPGPQRYSYSSMSTSRYVSEINPKLSPSKVSAAGAPRVSVLKPSAPLVKKPKPEMAKCSPKKIRQTESYCLSDTEDDGDESVEAESVYDRDSWVLETSAEKTTPLRRRGISQADKNRLANLLRQTSRKKDILLGSAL